MYRCDDHAQYGIHGIGHMARVLVWSAYIADLVQTPIRRSELLWAAALHDTQRWSDGVDAGHGERAAQWIVSTFPAIRPDIADTVDLPLVAQLCRNHDVSDDQITSWSDELRILKDADGLDRVRFNGLDLRYLRLQAITPALAPHAWLLMHESVGRGNTGSAVRDCAIEMHVWR